MSSVKVTAGKPTGGVTGVEVGTPTGMAVSIGKVRIDPPSPNSQSGAQLVPFNEFFKAIGGDKVKAEQMVPGITKAGGHKLLKAGPDGRPHVSVPQQHMPMLQAQDSAQAQDMTQKFSKVLDSAHDQHQMKALVTKAQLSTGQAAGGGAGGGDSGIPEWIPVSQFAQQSGFKDPSQLSADYLEATYPGISVPGGRAPWVRTNAVGAAMVRNPQSPAYKKDRLSVLQKMAEGEERAAGLAAQPYDPTQDRKAGRVPAQQVVAEDGN